MTGAGRRAGCSGAVSQGLQSSLGIIIVRCGGRQQAVVCVAAPGGAWRSVGFLFLPELQRVRPWRDSGVFARRGAVSHVAMPSAAPAHTNIAAV